MSNNAEKPSLLRWRLAGRIVVAALVVLGVGLVATHRQALDPAAITAAIGTSTTAPVLFLAAHVVASLLFVPRTLMAVAAGLLFGAVGGFIWAILGSLLGAIAGFLLARYVNSGLIEPESIPKLGPLLMRAENGGWRAVAIVRLIPILPHPVTNYGLGLTRLSLMSYTIGTFIGQIPMTIAYAEFGAAGQEAMAGGANWLMPTLIGFVVLAFSIVLPKLVARRT
jgi:uncharacterized membrane protein YdjX (TVP38/TMEM64 family)